MLSNEMIKGLVELRKYLGESEINVNDCQFKVLTQEEIDVEFYNFQVELFDEIGLNSLTDSCLMVPSKSVSAIVGVSEIDTNCHTEGCEACDKNKCEYRRG